MHLHGERVHHADRMPLNGLLGEQTFPPKSFPHAPPTLFSHPTSIPTLPRSTFPSNLPTIFYALQLINPRCIARKRGMRDGTIAFNATVKRQREREREVIMRRGNYASSSSDRAWMRGAELRSVAIEPPVSNRARLFGRLSKQCYFSARYARPI